MQCTEVAKSARKKNRESGYCDEVQRTRTFRLTHNAATQVIRSSGKRVHQLISQQPQNRPSQSVLAGASLWR